MLIFYAKYKIFIILIKITGQMWKAQALIASLQLIKEEVGAFTFLWQRMPTPSYVSQLKENMRTFGVGAAYPPHCHFYSRGFSFTRKKKKKEYSVERDQPEDTYISK